jgi:hypothetical protein
LCLSVSLLHKSPFCKIRGSNCIFLPLPEVAHLFKGKTIDGLQRPYVTCHCREQVAVDDVATCLSDSSIARSSLLLGPYIDSMNSDATSTSPSLSVYSSIGRASRILKAERLQGNSIRLDLTAHRTVSYIDYEHTTIIPALRTIILRT